MATIKGTAKKDKLVGTAAADTILGLGAADILLGGAGNDTIKGGIGNDTLSGDTGNDKLYGEQGNDKLSGGDGKDILDGGLGDDTLNGGKGNDRFVSGAGADKFIGGDGIDTVDYSKETGALALTLDNLVAAVGAALGDTFSGVENAIGTAAGDQIHGNSIANMLSGGAGDDVLLGKAGADTLVGGDGADGLYGDVGADTLIGGDGNDFLVPGGDTDADTVNGGDGIDKVSYFDSSTGVTVNLETGATGGGAAGDVLTSIEDVTGGDFDDFLTVDEGGETFGNDGNDTLSGSIAAGVLTTEELSGGSGNDNFVVHLNTGMDIITDFTLGVLFSPGDKLIFAAAEFGGITHEPGLFGASTAVNNVAGGGPIVANRASPQFIFDQLTSILYFDADGTGASEGPVPVALLIGVHTALTNGGFLGVDEFEII